MSGEQPPMSRCFAFGWIDLAGIDKLQDHTFREPCPSLIMFALIRSPDLDCCHSAAREPPDVLFGPVRQASSMVICPLSSQRSAVANRRRPILQSTILSRPHQLLNRLRLEREALVDIAFTIFDHRDTGGSSVSQCARAPGTIKPAPAVLFLKNSLLALRTLTAFARGEVDRRRRSGGGDRLSNGRGSCMSTPTPAGFARRAPPPPGAGGLAATPSVVAPPSFR